MGGKKVKRPQRAQRRKTGKMEYWNIGMLGKGNKMPKPIIRSFHHSNSFALRALGEKILFIFLEPVLPFL
jgi:hypothetical protein